MRGTRERERERERERDRNDKMMQWGTRVWAVMAHVKSYATLLVRHNERFKQDS